MDKKNLRWITGLTALLLLTGIAAGYQASLTHLILVVDGVSHAVATHQPTVRALLLDRGLTLRPEDRISPDLDTPLQEGMTISIERARPVIIVADGEERVVYTVESLPADILSSIGIVLQPHDTLRIDAPLPSDPPGTRSRLVVRRAVEIVLEENGILKHFYTDARTVGEALTRAGMRLYLADRIYPDPATPIQAGVHIRLERSLPIVVQVDGRTIPARTHRDRVGDVLADLGIVLNGKDYTQPALDAPVSADLQIKVVRVSERVYVQQSSIPFDTEWRPDYDLELDHQALLEEGEPGVLEQRIRVRFENGQEVARWVEGESVVKPTKSRIMGYGAKVVLRPLQTECGTVYYWRVIRVLATSYSASTAGTPPDSPWYGRTRTGLPMGYGIVAVDPSVIPLHTNLYIPGYGCGAAEDTGGAIVGRRVDLGYDDDNLRLWYTWVYVYLLEPVPAYFPYIIP